MTITSIGSSFSYISPNRAAGNSAPAATEETTESPANAASDGDDRGPAATPSAAAPDRPRKPSVSDEMQVVLVKAQETHRSAPPAASAARAYAGR